MIKVIVKRANEPSVETTIPGDLKNIQQIVGGYFTQMTLFHLEGGTIALLLNEDGEDLNLPLNFVVNGQPVLGNAVFVRLDSDGQIVSLTRKDIQTLRYLFQEPESNPVSENYCDECHLPMFHCLCWE